MCGSNWASYIPPSRYFHFFQYFLWNPAYGVFHTPMGFHFWYDITPTGFHFWVLEGVKFLVYPKREVKSPGPPRGVCTTPNLNHTLHISHFKKFCQKEKFLEMFKIAQLLKRKVFWKIAFSGQFANKSAKSALHQVEKWYQIVKSNAFWMILFDLEQNLTQSQIFRWYLSN